MRTLTLLLFVSLCTLVIKADLRAQGDSAYQHHNYIQAVTLYEQDLEHDSLDAHTYYNLGNAYYHLQQYPKAVLAYERALRLRPDFDAARHNCTLVKEKCKDHFDAPDESLLVTACLRVVNSMSADSWGYWALGTFALSLLFVAIYFLATSPLWRRIGFFVTLFFLVLALIFNILGSVARRIATHPRLVIMQETILYSSPTYTSKKLRTLHEGTTVTIISEMPRWTQVTLPDGKDGWLETQCGEHI